MTAEWWANGPDTVREPRDDGVDDDHDAHESAVRLPDGWTTTRIRCFLCAIAPLAPQPRVCAVCAGTGYVLTERTP